MPPARKTTSRTTTKKPVTRKKRSTKKTFAQKHKFKFIITLVVLLLFSPLYYGKLFRTAVSTGRWVKDLFIFDEYPNDDEFGIRIPRKYYVHGIDVSSYQGKINWEKVVAMESYNVKLSFAFIKATEGVTLVDSYFQRNWRESKEAGIIRGAYHYFKPKKSGKWQAKFFLQTVNLEAGDLPPVIDIEETGGLSKLELQLNLQEFLNEIEAKSKTKPIIYTGYKFFEDNLKEKFGDYTIWIAHYYQPKLKLPETAWHFWQHADNAHIDGIKGKVDMNVFNGDEVDLSTLLIQKSY